MAEIRKTFASAENGLDIPFGMVVRDQAFFLGNTAAILQFPYQNGQDQLREVRGNNIPVGANGHSPLQIRGIGTVFICESLTGKGRVSHNRRLSDLKDEP